MWGAGGNMLVCACDTEVATEESSDMSSHITQMSYKLQKEDCIKMVSVTSRFQTLLELQE